MRAAVIGVGSNSVRMLVADIQGGRLREVLRDREGTRLFGGLDEKGNLSRESMALTVKAVAAMGKKAAELDAQAIHLFATSAVRDAGNQGEFSELVRGEAGLELEILTGESEAALSFLGAAGGAHAGVIDIGGGSTEVVIGRGAAIDAGVSLQLGAVRLNRLYPITSSRDVPAVVEAAGQILERNMDRLVGAGLPARWVGVGGTFTALAALMKDVPWTEKTRLNGYALPRDAVLGWLERLSDMSLKERLALKGLQPQRADIMAHGTAILAACMDKLLIATIHVSEFGNLDGYLKRKYLLVADRDRE